MKLQSRVLFCLKKVWSVKKTLKFHNHAIYLLLNALKSQILDYETGFQKLHNWAVSKKIFQPLYNLGVTFSFLICDLNKIF
jgi:hypothetical protein